MRYKDIITLARNSRGCYILDTVKGCPYSNITPGGCYGECYAANIAKRYGMDFSTAVKRMFIEDKGQLYFDGYYDVKHESNIIDHIRNIGMPFVRIGEMGDPSAYWEHTIDICDKIKVAGKPIVIITKHINAIPENLLDRLNGVIINTSISALDSKKEITHRLTQYKRLKKYCKSLLRVVTAEFNIDDPAGKYLNSIQDMLLTNLPAIETVFRPSSGNNLVEREVIKVEKKHFLKGNVLASVRDKSAFMGYCYDCPDMCGVNL